MRAIIIGIIVITLCGCDSAATDKTNKRAAEAGRAFACGLQLWFHVKPPTQCEKAKP